MCLLGTGCLYPAGRKRFSRLHPRALPRFSPPGGKALLSGAGGPEWRHQHADACPRTVVVAGLRQRSDPATDATPGACAASDGCGRFAMTPSVNQAVLTHIVQALKEGQIRYCESLGFSPQELCELTRLTADDILFLQQQRRRSSSPPTLTTKCWAGCWRGWSRSGCFSSVWRKRCLSARPSSSSTTTLAFPHRRSVPGDG